MPIWRLCFEDLRPDQVRWWSPEVSYMDVEVSSIEEAFHRGLTLSDKPDWWGKFQSVIYLPPWGPVIVEVPKND